MYGMTHARAACICVTHMCDTTQHLDGCPGCRIRLMSHTQTNNLYNMTHLHVRHDSSTWRIHMCDTHVWHCSTPWWLSWMLDTTHVKDTHTWLLNTHTHDIYRITHVWHLDGCPERPLHAPWQKFSKVSSLLNLLYTTTGELTFENVYIACCFAVTNGLPIRDVAVLTWLTSSYMSFWHSWMSHVTRLMSTLQRTADPWRCCFDMTHVVRACHSYKTLLFWHHSSVWYGVATTSRLLRILGLFCRTSSLL